MDLRKKVASAQFDEQNEGVLAREHIKAIEEIELDIQEAEGEMTDEQVELLDYHQSMLVGSEHDFKERVLLYFQTTKVIESDNHAIDLEIKRLRTLKTINSNIITRVKKAVITGLIQFGEKGKTGNSKMRLPTLNMWTKKTEAVEVDMNSIPEDYKDYTINEKFSKHEIDTIKQVMNNQFEDKIGVSVSKTKVKRELKDIGNITGVKIINNESLTWK